jgi:serine/threonine-protein kinase
MMRAIGRAQRPIATTGSSQGMSVADGSRLGPYEILSLIGSGGMGEVYRAHDARLGRDVAIKFLPREFTSDPERLARFEREARALAALNHPNVASIYGVEDCGETRALVMELVDGELLAARIANAKSGLPVKEALALARQLAAALDAAHDKGIVHRDLKPANVKITSGGLLKVLDFCLAKSADPAANALATMTTGNTLVGTIIGTPAYMSPEQARGQPIDRRTDVFAFGCILYEMLTGSSPFLGEDTADTLARVLRRDPDLAALPPNTPPGIKRLISLCLEKDRAKRLGQIAIAAYEIDTTSQPLAIAPESSSPATARVAAAVSALVVIGAVAVWVAGLVRSSDPPPVTRLSMGVAPADEIGRETSGQGEGAGAQLPGSPSRTAIAISPDGRTIVFSAARGSQSALYRRALEQEQATPIPGTDGAAGPFFSPDGRWIGYWSAGALRKVPVDGGPSIQIATTPLPFGVSWGDDDRIVFAGAASGLFEVSAAGGTPSEIVKPDAALGEVSYRLPHVLPGNDGVLFTVTRNRFPRWDQTEIFVYSRSSERAKPVLVGGADARYVDTGHLLFVRESVLLAAPFDRRDLRITAAPIGVVGDVMQAAYARGQNADSGAAQFSVSATGTFAYLKGGVVDVEERSLVRVDRAGREESFTIGARPFTTLRLSPDGKQLALGTSGRDRDIWLLSLERQTLTKLAVAGRHSVPIWTPDGQWLTYASSPTGLDQIYRVRADGSVAAPERLVASTNNLVPGTWTPDGRTLFYYEISPARSWIWANTSGTDPTEVSGTSATGGGVDVSPDGRWVTYHSAESGQYQVYVQAHPGPGPRYQVSTDGGGSPIWRADGRELFYARPAGTTRQPQRASVTIMAVPVAMGPDLTLGAPAALFEGSYEMNAPARAYDVSADGELFYFMKAVDRPREVITQIAVIQNWFEELERLVPAR